MKSIKQNIPAEKNELILPDLFNKKLSPKQIEQYAQEKEEIYRKIYRPHIKEVSGLKKLIKQIRNKRLAIAMATNSPDKNRDFVVEELDLKVEDFDVIIGPNQVSTGKPNPEIYLKVATLLNIESQYLIAFEDTPKGIQSAKSAGIKVFALLTSHIKEELSLADGIIKDFTEIEII